MTVKWLEECLLQEKIQSEDDYIPLYVKDSKDTGVTDEEMQKFRKA